MPPLTQRRAFLSPDIIWQLKTLFGTGTNAHDRLGLHEIVPRAELQKALAGWPIRTDHEHVITHRWAEWRRKFLSSPSDALIVAERTARAAGDYYDPEARDLVTEKLVPAELVRFTLQPDARKYL